MLERFKVPEEDKVYVDSEKVFELTKNILKNIGVSDDGASNTDQVDGNLKFAYALGKPNTTQWNNDSIGSITTAEVSQSQS